MRLMASCGVSYCTIWFKKDDYSPYWIPHQPVEGWPILVASGLATPRLGSPGHKWELAWNISKWTLLDRNLPGTTLCCTSRFQPRDPTMLWYRKKSSAWHELDSRIPSFKGHGIMIPWVVPFSSHPGCLQGSPEAVVSAVGSDLGGIPILRPFEHVEHDNPWMVSSTDCHCRKVSGPFCSSTRPCLSCSPWLP